MNTVKMLKKPVEVNKIDLTKYVTEGLTRDEIKAKYTTETYKMKDGDLNRLLKVAGLKLKRTVIPKFVLTEATSSTNTTTPQNTTTTEIAQKS